MQLASLAGPMQKLHDWAYTEGVPREELLLDPDTLALIPKTFLIFSDTFLKDAWNDFYKLSTST